MDTTSGDDELFNTVSRYGNQLKRKQLIIQKDLQLHFFSLNKHNIFDK